MTKLCVDGQVVQRRWGDLRVDDIIKIERNDHIPADIVILGSSGDFGVSYVETKSLGKRWLIWCLRFSNVPQTGRQT